MCNVKDNVYVQSYAEEQHFVRYRKNMWWFEMIWERFGQIIKKTQINPNPNHRFQNYPQINPNPNHRTLNQSQSNHLFLRVWFESDLNQIRLDSAQVWFIAHSLLSNHFHLRLKLKLMITATYTCNQIWPSTLPTYSFPHFPVISPLPCVLLLCRASHCSC